MRIAFTLATIVLLSSCASNEPRTEAQIDASIEAKTALIKGALQPGTDKRCVSVVSIFEFCYSRERTVN